MIVNEMNGIYERLQAQSPLRGGVGGYFPTFPDMQIISTNSSSWV